MFKLFQSILSRLPSDSVDLSARRDIFSRPKQVNSKDRTETLELPPSNPTTSTPACWETHRPKLTVQTCYLQHTHTPPHPTHLCCPSLSSTWLHKSLYKLVLELKNINMNLRVELWRDPLIESIG